MVGGGCCYVSTSKGMENKEKEAERGNLSVRMCQPRIRGFEYDVRRRVRRRNLLRFETSACELYVSL